MDCSSVNKHSSVIKDSKHIYVIISTSRNTTGLATTEFLLIPDATLAKRGVLTTAWGHTKVPYSLIPSQILHK